MASEPFVLSPVAEADLASIWLYTATQWSVDQADRYSLEIHNACRALATGRRQGRSLDKVRAGYLKLSIGSHFIVYRFVNGTVDVIRILHQRMDIASHLEH